MTESTPTRRRPLGQSIAEHILDWRALTWPVDWSEVFGRQAPLVLEIGFGNGEFLAQQAREHPERDHVGIELSWSGAFRLLKRLGSEQTNVRALLIDAELALGRLFPAGSLAEVIVNHPWPWPKDRHHERRLLHPAMLRVLAHRMADDAPITIVTDHAEYAAWVAERLAAQRDLVSRHDTVEVAAIPGRLTTKYERKAVAQGIPIHYFEWRKGRTPEGVADPEPSPSASQVPMPSVKLTRAPADPFGDFAPVLWRETFAEQEVIVRLQNVWRRVGSGVETSWLVDTLVQEGRLRQDFGLLVVHRQPDELLLKLADVGRPHPTHGVKRAVFVLAQWIRERHPAATIVHENLGAEAMAPAASPSNPDA